MSEAELQAAVVELARWHGWLVMHITDSRKSIGVGFPDLVMVHKTTGRVVYAELKSTKGKVKPAQQEWIDALQRGGHNVQVWRPEHWHSGAVRALIGASRGAA